MESQLKILLAGYGDIASRLAISLAEKGIVPIAVKRTPLSQQSNVVFKAGDLRDSHFVKKLLTDQTDVIVVSITPSNFSDQGYCDSYIAVAKNLVSEIDQAAIKPKLVLWVSSTSVYGVGNGDWVDEQTTPKPLTFSGKRLLEAENIIASLHIPYSIVRFSGIYGPGRNRMIEQIKAGNSVAPTPKVWSNRIHSEDCAGVLEHLIALHQKGGELQTMYLASDSKPTPIYEVQQWLIQQLGIKNNADKAPPARANRRCSNQRLLNSGYRFKYAGYQQGYKKLL